MTDIRCPMCSRLNPSDLEVCQYCQARLKPLIISPFTGEGSPLKPGEPPEKQDDSDIDSALPDWLSDLRQKDEQEPASEPEESLPAWLPEEPEETQPSGEPGIGDSSNWWSRITPEDQAHPSPEPEETPQEETGPILPPSDAAEQPGQESESDLWVSTPGAGLGDEKPDLPQSPEEGEEPEWLQRIRARQQGEEEPLQNVFLSDQEQDAGEELSQELPDWLAEAKVGPDEKPASSEGEIPAWLSGLSQEDKPAPGGESFEQPQQPSPEPLPDEESMPDWLLKLETSAGDQPSEPSTPAFIIDEDSDLAYPTGEEHKPEQPAGEEESAESPSLSTLPEWLSQVSAESESQEGEAAPEEQEPGITPAQLPTWLEAMRPVEAAAPAAPSGEDFATQIEKVGPLAGLRGVLPAESVIGHLQKPPSYSVKLQVSESQQRNSVLLQKLLASENESKPIPQRAGFTSQAVLRLVIAAALFLAVLLPLWLDSQKLPLPDPANIPDGLIETSQLIGALDGGKPVLVAVDYEPGLSAEMDSIASSIILQITSRGSELALVSTNPIGPVLAERLMSGLNQDSSQAPVRYTNLGFIAGGSTGLVSFAEAPRKILPYDLGSSGQRPRSNLWEIEPFRNIQSAADFAMLVVITENAGTARSWVEQVQPVLQSGNIPMVMAISAQVEPMIRPYFDSAPKQVNGLVVGLQGGVAFEGMTGQTGRARGYWDAFGSGLLVAEVLILVGGLINIILALLVPHKDSEVEGTP